MQCRNCGTEIADKAIVCYRCGVPTTDPVRKPVPIGRARSAPSLLSAIAILVLAVIVASLGQTSGVAPYADAVAIVLGLAGVGLLGARFIRRR